MAVNMKEHLQSPDKGLQVKTDPWKAEGTHLASYSYRRGVCDSVNVGGISCLFLPLYISRSLLNR